jgi:hypothetical protein
MTKAEATTREVASDIQSYVGWYYTEMPVEAWDREHLRQKLADQVEWLSKVPETAQRALVVVTCACKREYRYETLADIPAESVTCSECEQPIINYHATAPVKFAGDRERPDELGPVDYIVSAPNYETFRAYLEAQDRRSEKYGREWEETTKQQLGDEWVPSSPLVPHFATRMVLCCEGENGHRLVYQYKTIEDVPRESVRCECGRWIIQYTEATP